MSVRLLCTGILTNFTCETHNDFQKHLVKEQIINKIKLFRKIKRRMIGKDQLVLKQGSKRLLLVKTNFRLEPIPSMIVFMLPGFLV